MSARFRKHGSTEIDFERINREARRNLIALCGRWLEGGYVRGREFIACNPRRNDRRPGSFKINLITGAWADFALDDARGGDPVSLLAYLAGIGQAEAARKLAAMLGILEAAP